MGPVLSDVFINDLDEGWSEPSVSLKMIRLGRMFGLLEGRKALWRDLDCMSEHADAICMRFNKAKSQVLPLSHSNPCSSTAWGRVAGKMVSGKGPGDAL